MELTITETAMDLNFGEVLRISPDGTVTLFVIPAEAARAFWELVQKVAPAGYHLDMHVV